MGVSAGMATHFEEVFEISAARNLMLRINNNSHTTPQELLHKCKQIPPSPSKEGVSLSPHERYGALPQPHVSFLGSHLHSPGEEGRVAPCHPAHTLQVQVEHTL